MRKLKSRYPDRLLTIDPGLCTGIAIWNGTELPTTHEILLPNKMRSISMQMKMYWMLEQFDNLVVEECSHIEEAIIEGAGVWWGNTKSVIAARMGNTFFLSYIIGAYFAILGKHNISTTIVPVPEWKGNKSKEDIANEVYGLNGKRYSSDHISDAVGIGFSHAGMITRKHIKLEDLFNAKKTKTTSRSKKVSRRQR